MFCWKNNFEETITKKMYFQAKAERPVYDAGANVCLSFFKDNT